MQTCKPTHMFMSSGGSCLQGTAHKKHRTCMNHDHPAVCVALQRMSHQLRTFAFSLEHQEIWSPLTKQSEMPAFSFPTSPPRSASLIRSLWCVSLLDYIFWDRYKDRHWPNREKRWPKGKIALPGFSRNCQDHHHQPWARAFQDIMPL